MRSPPVRPRRRPRLLLAAAYGAGFASLVAWAACATPPPVGVIPTVIQPGTTSVSVDPSVFLGAVECSTLPGAMQSYVATVTDQTGRKFPLPSSPPTACSQSTFFNDIVVGDIFTAEVDGYDLPADQLVPTCGAPPPGGPQPCHSDADCGMAYGCQGSCRVSLFVNEDFSCLQGCLYATDAGAPTAQQVAAFATCVGMANDCAAPTVDGYVSCAVGCANEAIGAEGANAFAACLAASNDCLLSDIPVLQQECSTAPAMQAGGIPSGGVPDGGLADGGGDLVLTGEVQACNCVYPVAEGSRQMYLRMTKARQACTDDAECCPFCQSTGGSLVCPPSLPCPPGACTNGVCQSIPAVPRWKTPSNALCGQGLGQDEAPCEKDSDCVPGRLCQDHGAQRGSFCDPQSVAYTNVSITPCTIQDTESDAGVTAIEVVAGALLASSPMAQPGAPACVSSVPDGGAGTVTSFDIVPTDPSVVASAPSTGLLCASNFVTGGLTFTGGPGGLVPNHAYAFAVVGYDGSSSPAYSACCYATARAGVEVTAMCDPLTPVGDGGLPLGDAGIPTCN